MINPVVIIPNLDTPNKNGRVYTTELAERLVLQYASRDIYGCVGLPGAQPNFLDLEKINHKISNLRIEENALVGDVTIFQLEEIYNLPDVSFRMRGVGNFISKNGSITVTTETYQLISIDLLENPA